MLTSIKHLMKWATPKLLWCHWDHVTRSALLILSCFGSKWSKLVQREPNVLTQPAQEAARQHMMQIPVCDWASDVGLIPHQQAVWCLTHCVFLLLWLNVFCIDISLQTLSSVSVKACLAASRAAPRLLWARYYRLCTSGTQGDSANLLCRSSKAPSGFFSPLVFRIVWQSFRYYKVTTGWLQSVCRNILKLRDMDALQRESVFSENIS